MATIHLENVKFFDSFPSINHVTWNYGNEAKRTYQCTNGLAVESAGSTEPRSSMMSAKQFVPSGTLYHSTGGETSFTAPWPT